MLVVSLALFSFASCSKDNTPAFHGKTKVYALFSYRDPINLAQAGTFTITELSDGNAKGTLRLNSAFTVAGATLNLI
jgi:hypothetical protein